MRRLALAAALLACPLASAAEGPGPGERALEWVASETPARLLESDIRESRLRFFIFCGISCDLRSVDDQTYELCFSNHASAEEMAGTTDFAETRRHSELVRAAERFVVEYNRGLAAHLTAKGLRDCPPQGSPESWLAPVQEVVRRVDPDASVWAAPKGWGGSQLQVVISPEAVWTDQDDDRVCAALAKGGLNRRFTFGARLPAGQVAAEFACENGATVP
jgi:hypothetical protein